MHVVEKLRKIILDEIYEIEGSLSAQRNDEAMNEIADKITKDTVFEMLKSIERHM